MGTAPEDFEYRVAGAYEVLITHWGRRATVLRGMRARNFLMDIEHQEPQELMARVTGNYKRGNERKRRIILATRGADSRR